MPTPNDFTDFQFNASDKDNPQFTSDKTGDPQALLEQTRGGVDAHAELNESFGLCQPVADMGQHAWLRDGLAKSGQVDGDYTSPKD